jgi:hypothetical protein
VVDSYWGRQQNDGADSRKALGLLDRVQGLCFLAYYRHARLYRVSNLRRFTASRPTMAKESMKFFFLVYPKNLSSTRR